MITPAQATAALPGEVRDLASRLGATGDEGLVSVMLKQRGTMRDRPRSRKMRFLASQRIHLRQTEFEWRASIGPFGWLSVVDALRQEEVELAVRIFGRLQIAGARHGAAAAKGATMRYLAELAWAPDAILCNAALTWATMDDRTMRVGAGQGSARGEVRLGLDDSGRIASVFAPDRPRKEGSSFVERPWRGRFFNYRQHQGRWLPFSGEVGWLLDGQEFVAWQGEILDWTVA